jgi:hypothetical protein
MIALLSRGIPSLQKYDPRHFVQCVSCGMDAVRLIRNSLLRWGGPTTPCVLRSGMSCSGLGLLSQPQLLLRDAVSRYVSRLCLIILPPAAIKEGQGGRLFRPQVASPGAQDLAHAGVTHRKPLSTLGDPPKRGASNKSFCISAIVATSSGWDASKRFTNRRRPRPRRLCSRKAGIG